jgi:glycopeptide antibiotics resistance protein
MTIDLYDLFSLSLSLYLSLSLSFSLYLAEAFVLLVSSPKDTSDLILNALSPLTGSCEKKLLETACFLVFFCILTSASLLYT